MEKKFVWKRWPGAEHWPKNQCFVPNKSLEKTHNEVGLRSNIRGGGFLASSNIVLKVFVEKTMCSSGNEVAEDLEVALFSHKFNHFA